VIFDEGEFFVAAVLLETTIENIKQNSKIAIAAAGEGAESYQVKGTAELVTEGPEYEYFVKLADDTFKGAFPCKCAVKVTSEKLIVASPNGQNKQELAL